MITYTAFPVGANANGNPVYRIVTDGLQVAYVTIPRKRSDASTVDLIITHALEALHASPRPVR